MIYHNPITICEVGLRDGLQNESILLSAKQKIDFINNLVSAGVRVIEVGSFMHPKAVPQMANTDEVFQGLTMHSDVEYRALVANMHGINRAIACGCSKIKLNVSASRKHNLANLNCLPEETVTSFNNMVNTAKANGLSISGSISMAFGSEWEGKISLEEIATIVQAYIDVGVSEISLSDSAGIAHPDGVTELCNAMSTIFPNVKWWLHFHNTRGLGIANFMAGVKAGFTHFDTSLSGIGGCPFIPGASGNIATEDILNLCIQSGLQTGIEFDKIIALSRTLSTYVDHPTDSYLLRVTKDK